MQSYSKNIVNNLWIGTGVIASIVHDGNNNSSRKIFFLFDIIFIIDLNLQMKVKVGIW
jgi:hypothetical protein